MSNINELKWPRAGTMSHHVLLLCYVGFSNQEIFEDLVKQRDINTLRTSLKSVERRRSEFRADGHSIPTDGEAKKRKRSKIIEFGNYFGVAAE